MSSTGYIRGLLLDGDPGHEPDLQARGPQAYATSLKRNIRPPVVVRGLPGIGKTTLANELEKQFKYHLGPQAVFRINADEMRATICRDLGFSREDRCANARRIGGLVRMAALQGFQVIADFVMPSTDTLVAYTAFAKGLNNQIFSLEAPSNFNSRFRDSNAMWTSATEWQDLKDGTEVWPIKPYAPSEVGAVATAIVFHTLVQKFVEL